MSCDYNLLLNLQFSFVIVGGAFLSCDYNHKVMKILFISIVGGANLSCDKTVWSVSLEQEVFPQNSHSHSILTLGVLILSVTEQNENE